MTTSRETIYAACLAALQLAVTDLPFKTFSRRMMLWTQVPIDRQPALFLKQVREEIVLQGDDPNALPAKTAIYVDAVIYCNAGSDITVSSAPLLNAAVDAIEKFFKPGPNHKSPNLGISGVLGARVVGTVEYGEGNLDGQGIAAVPIRIIAL